MVLVGGDPHHSGGLVGQHSYYICGPCVMKEMGKKKTWTERCKKVSVKKIPPSG
jgi:hypothetical protein